MPKKEKLTTTDGRPTDESALEKLRCLSAGGAKNKRPPGLIAPLLRFWHLLGNPPKNTTKDRDLIFNEGIRLLNMADTSLDRWLTHHWIDSLDMK